MVSIQHGNLNQYSPSSLVTYTQSPFSAWMERAHRLYPRRYTPDVHSDEAQLLFRKGNEHEQEYVQHLKEQGYQVVEIEGDMDDEREVLTTEAMTAGADVIVQAQLSHTPFYGRADFLFKVAGEPSKFGNYHYTLGDTKLSKTAKAQHVLQLCVYAEMLEALQDKRPEFIQVILGDGSVEQFELSSVWHAYQQVRTDFLKFQEQFDINQPPEPNPGDNWGRWTSVATQWLEEQDHLIRVANITQSQIKKLKLAEITTLTELTQTDKPFVKKLAADTFTKLRHQAQLQLKTIKDGKPAFQVKSHSGGRIGLGALPPKSPNDSYFDIEGDPYMTGGLEYLFGVTYLNADQSLAFKDWWAHDHGQEKQLLEDFLDWVMGRYRQDPSLHIYHYANYEIAALRKLTGRYGTREDELDTLLRNEVFVDLYRVVSQGLTVGMPSYSIKDIEQVFRSKRAGEVQSGGASIAVYENWRDSPDGNTWETSAILNSIREYNKEDTDSTYYATEWLRRIQEDASITYRGKESVRSEELTEANSEPHPKQVLMQSILAKASVDALFKPINELDNDERVRVLMAHLVEFYHREDKPTWWAYFDRRDLTGFELLSDTEAIGLAHRTITAPTPIARSLLYEFEFDPTQEYKLRQGSGVKLLWGSEKEVGSKIETLDSKNGRFTIKMTAHKATETGIGKLTKQDEVNVIPFERPLSQQLDAVLQDILEAYNQTDEIKPCLRDFLYRNPPKLSGHLDGNLIDVNKELTPQAVKLGMNLNQTCLCIQGPPGTGKSYTGSRMILEWLKAGKRVGISSNSHKAINNLIHKVIGVAQEERFDFVGAKIRSDDEPEFMETCVQSIRNNQLTEAYQLVGGTAWTFIRDDLEDAIDILVIDEAGQVSLANLVAMSRCTKNIVLLGDQMQLPQPLQGSHPGESGLSILEYYLQDHATIPPNLGIFLGETRRCPVGITEFISDVVYEGHLIAHESTKYREIQHGNDSPLLANFGKPAGIVTIPVAHEGNTQASEEEVIVIADICNELLGATYQHYVDDIRSITPDNILVVAPYNQQVIALQRGLKPILGEDARIGTVDKFQGQEAPVVIVSMAASSAEELPRGMEFLLSKNRLNVALSRAQALAIVVASPQLAKPSCHSIAQLELINPFARLFADYKIGVKSY